MKLRLLLIAAIALMPFAAWAISETLTVTVVPSAAVSCQTPTPPAAAQAAGFTTLVLGPCVNIASGANWVNYHQPAESSAGPLQATTNSDGSVTIRYNGGTGTLETPQAFGGGLYVQATFSASGPTPSPSWCGTGGSDPVWPTFWANSVPGTYANGDWNMYVGNPPYTIETDVSEIFCSATQNHSTIHRWGATHVYDQQIFALPSGMGGTNTYGMLWVPATPSSQGYVQWYLNGQPQGYEETWNYGDTSSWGLLDTQYLQFYLTTSPEAPMTVYSVEAWQGPSGRVLNP